MTTLETLRLASLARAGLQQDGMSARFDRFDRLSRLTAALLQVPKSLVTVVDDDTQHVIGQNLDGDFVVPRHEAFCSVVVAEDELLVVEDARTDARFAGNPHVSCEPGVRFYAGAPLRSTDGLVLGALCIIDERPRRFTNEQATVLSDLASLAADEIRLVRTSQSLAETAARLQHIVRVTSHDLRGTLGAVDGYAALIADEAPPGGSIAEFAAALTEVSAHALHLLTELLDTAVLDGAPSLALAPVDLGALVTGVATTIAPATRAKGQRLEVEVPATPVHVTASETRLRQALDNLASNAVKFTPPGGTVRLCASVGGRVTVEDSGPGIPADRRDDVFEPFAGLPNRPTGDETTTGLGLSIAAQSVRMQGGTIAVGESDLGGARFAVALPLA